MARGALLPETMYRIRTLLLPLLLLLLPVAALAQRVTGVVTDARTGEALPFVNVVYERGAGVQTDTQGRFSLPLRSGRLRFSMIGYETRTLRPEQGHALRVKLTPLDNAFGEAVVRGRKAKYSRKDNPAVELMRRVIAAKGGNDLKQRPFYSVDKYTKMTFALNEVTEKVFQEGKFKRLPFLKEHVEVCNETGTLILPVSVNEKATREIYRRKPESRKTIIRGERQNGLNDFFATGDMLTTLLEDCFTDVDLYDDNILLLRKTFLSPIATHGAIGFYRYFIEDTLQVDGERCVRLDFTPNNKQDVALSGSLFVSLGDQPRVVRADVGIPHGSGVNFVERMRVIQTYKRLPDGSRVIAGDDMIVQLALVDFLQKLLVRRTTAYTGYDFAAIPERDFDFDGPTYVLPEAAMQTDDFWRAQRPAELSQSEDRMALMMKRLQGVKGFNFALFALKAFLENFVETSKNPQRPSRVDIGPVNTIVSDNFVEGLRLRASAQTTAYFNPHLFLKGYVAYGTKDARWKGMGEVTYAVNKKKYSPHEFPVNNVTLSYANDVMSPSDKFLPTDKDNVFTSFKWTEVDHMQYYETWKLSWEREWRNNLRFKLQLRTERDRPTAALFYQSLDGGSAPSPSPVNRRHTFRTTDFCGILSYQPGTTWIHTKQHRIPANHNAPIYMLQHTTGVYAHQGRNRYYHLTEASYYKRFWLNSWGRLTTKTSAGVQWARVPFPLLIMPAANLSYVGQYNMFNMLDNMEFPTDRYATFMLDWDVNGKLFNRIPLFRRLKWREHVGFNVLWGDLTHKNDPTRPENAGDARLFYFPGRYQSDGTFQYLSRVIDPAKPYMEYFVGVTNIFKFFQVDYVHRMNYTDRPGTKKHGVRLMMTVKF